MEIKVEQGEIEFPKLKNVSELHKYLFRHGYVFVRAWTKNSPASLGLSEVLSTRMGDIYEEWNCSAGQVVLRILGNLAKRRHHPHIEEYDDMHEALQFVRRVR